MKNRAKGVRSGMAKRKRMFQEQKVVHTQGIDLSQPQGCEIEHSGGKDNFRAMLK